MIIYASITIEYRISKDDVHWEDLLNTEVSFFYGVAVIIWLTLFIVSWRRKQNTIANEWLVRNFRDTTLESKEFKYDAEIDPDTHHSVKVAKKRTARIVYVLGFFISAIFMMFVILGQVFLEYANYKLDRVEGEVHYFLAYIPDVVNVIIIGILG